MPRLQRIEGRLALVTGAASGIGRHTALALHRAGAKIIACDLDQDGLADLGGELRDGLVMSRKVDVADREAMRAFAQAVHDEHGPLDILVNNAGVAVQGTFLDTSLDDWDWIVGINFWGVIHGCHFFVPAMVQAARGREGVGRAGWKGHVVNVSSVLGYAGMPEVSAYCATKFAVLGFSESLRAELIDSGIGVTTICPGIVNTPIVARARYPGKKRDPDAVRSKVVNTYQKRNFGPDRVARAIISGITRGRDVVPVAPEAWGLYYMKRLTPSALPRLGNLINRAATRS